MMMRTITMRSYLLTLNTNTLLPIVSLNINDTQTIHTCVPIIFSWAWNYLYSKVCCKQLIANLFLGGSGENVLSSQKQWCRVFLWQLMVFWNQSKRLPVWKHPDDPGGEGFPGQSLSSLVFNVPLSWHPQILSARLDIPKCQVREDIPNQNAPRGSSLERPSVGAKNLDQLYCQPIRQYIFWWCTAGETLQVMQPRWCNPGDTPQISHSEKSIGQLFVGQPD